MKQLEIEEKERKLMFSRMILQFFSRMIEPEEVCSDANKLQFVYLVCTDYANETVKDRAI